MPLPELLDELFRRYRRHFSLIVVVALIVALPGAVWQRVTGTYKLTAGSLLPFAWLGRAIRRHRHCLGGRRRRWHRAAGPARPRGALCRRVPWGALVAVDRKHDGGGYRAHSRHGPQLGAGQEPVVADL